MEPKYDTKVTEAVIRRMEEFREIDRTFSEYERKISREIEAKKIEVVNKVREIGEEMKEVARQHLEVRKKGIKSIADIKNPKYLGISFEEETTTNKRIEALFGTILPCAGNKITKEQRDEFYNLPEVFYGQIVDDFNCEELKEDVSQMSSTKEADDRCSWQFKVKKQGKNLLFLPVMTNLKPEKGPLNLIFHYRIYLIWNKEPQLYLQIVDRTTEHSEYKAKFDLKKLPEETQQFKIHCIIQTVDERPNAKLEKLTFPFEGKELTEKEKNDYNLTVNTIQIEDGFTCKELAKEEIQGSRRYTTNLGFSFGLEVKKDSKFLCVRPVISQSNTEVPFKPIIHLKFYLIWDNKPQYYLEMDRTMTETLPAFQKLIFWDELTANTDQFKIRCVLLNADKRVQLTNETEP